MGKLQRAAVLLAVLAAVPARAADLTLTETGSTLMKPLFDVLVPEYAKSHPGVEIATAATGSGAGEAQALSGQVMIGASDAYLSDSEVRKNPDFLDIPIAISAQTINYNLPGLDTANLRLDGPTIAAIYTGAIRQWDAPAIAALNPGVSLPHQAIIAVHRKDGSGDTFIFTQFLTFSTPTWESGKGYATELDWPSVPGALAAEGNAGMVQTMAATPYSIGYVGVSFAAQVAEGKLGTAMLKNEAGQFVLPNRDAVVTAAATLGVRTPPDERLTLVFAPGEASYPLVNYEYAVVSDKQPDPAVAAALRRFLLWCILPSEEREEDLEKVHFVPLPPHIWELSQAQIEQVR
jgi:phosphate transport system substrate-binding protein